MPSETPAPESSASAARQAFTEALTKAVRIAAQDRRGRLAKAIGYVPGWQRGRWQIADELELALSDMDNGTA